MAEALLPNPAAPALADQAAWERRLRAEWGLLQQMIALNPMRLADPDSQDTTFFVTLKDTPAPALNGSMLTEHRLRVVYPRFFPTLPLELYLQQPVLHPNIHPVTGFVCLWDVHRVSNSVELALHKTVAMLGWTLLNLEPRHVMQPEAVNGVTAMQTRYASFGARPLTGLAFNGWQQPKTTVLRRRLS